MMRALSSAPKRWWIAGVQARYLPRLTRRSMWMTAAIRQRSRSNKAIMDEATRPTSPRSHRAEAIRLHAAGQVTEARALLSAAAATTEAASASSSSKAAADDPMSEALAAWCLKFLGRPPPLALREFADTGRGLAAGSAGLCAGDDILAIPLSCVLTSQGRLPSHPLLDGWHEDLRLALALLLEPLRDADGPWARYTPLLPSPPPSALHWSAEQLERLAGTPVPQQVADLRETLCEAHSAAFPTLRADLPHIFPPAPEQQEEQEQGDGDPFSLGRFLWAYSIVETRGLVLELQPGVKTTALVPLADMLNHNVTAALAWPVVEGRAAAATATVATAATAVSDGGRGGGDGADKRLVFRALRDVRPYAEVCLYYGRLTSLQTLQYYGFVDSWMLGYETVQVELEMPEEEIRMEDLPVELQRTMMAGGGGGGGEEEEEEDDGSGGAVEAIQAIGQEQQAMRVSLMEQRGLGLVHHLRSDNNNTAASGGGGGGALPTTLVQALRVLTMSADEVRAAAAHAASDGQQPLHDDDDDTVDERVVDALRDVIAGMAAVLVAPTSSAEEEDGLRGEEVEESESRRRSKHDQGIDAAIDSYVRFQQRVVRGALQDLAMLTERTASASETNRKRAREAQAEEAGAGKQDE